MLTGLDHLDVCQSLCPLVGGGNGLIEAGPLGCVQVHKASGLGWCLESIQGAVEVLVQVGGQVGELVLIMLHLVVINLAGSIHTLQNSMPTMIRCQDLIIQNLLPREISAPDFDIGVKQEE